MREHQELVAQLRQAIDIPSPTGQEGDYARHVVGWLEEQGYPQVELQSVEGERANVWARAGERPRVVLCTHLDCVPPWIGSSEDEVNVYGTWWMTRAAMPGRRWTLARGVYKSTTATRSAWLTRGLHWRGSGVNRIGVTWSTTPA